MVKTEVYQEIIEQELIGQIQVLMKIKLLLETKLKVTVKEFEVQCQKYGIVTKVIAELKGKIVPEEGKDIIRQIEMNRQDLIIHLQGMNHHELIVHLQGMNHQGVMAQVQEGMAVVAEEAAAAAEEEGN